MIPFPRAGPDAGACSAPRFDVWRALLNCEHLRGFSQRRGLEGPVIIHTRDVQARSVGSTLKILPLWPGEAFAFDVAQAELTGDHNLVVNTVSDRCYYFLSGSAKVTVGDDTYQAEATDLIVIPKGIPHGLVGIASYLIITSPPFDPGNDKLPGG